MRALVLLLLVLAVSGCPSSTPSADSGTGGSGGSGGGTTASGGGATGTGGGATPASDGGIVGLELLAKLPGLWSGPATMTPLGTFPMMNFDLRPVDGQFVFGQADLDATDTLRFGFSIETYGGQNVLAYRNGGFFGGVLRDTRTALVDTDGGTWRFCYVGDGGCSYIDARFTVSDQTLVLNAQVKGQPHVDWNAQKVETRTVPNPFPSDTTSRGDGSAPWPTLASVQANVTLGVTTAAPADVWLILTTTPCFPTFNCNESRAVMVTVAASATSAVVNLPNVHAGAYKATLLVDLDRNFESTHAPSSGDRAAIDQDLTVPTVGLATLNATTSVAVP